MNGVNHPDHYNIPGKKECIVEMREKFGDALTAIFCLMNAYKYQYRAGSKEGETAEKDWEKALWYITYSEQFLLENFTESNIINYVDKLHKDVLKNLFAKTQKEEKNGTIKTET